MPVDEVKCAGYGRQFENLVSLSVDATKTECPSCGKRVLDLPLARVP